jgi:putative NIF3 family GTP cyclohydrolase 1 type 2
MRQPTVHSDYPCGVTPEQLSQAVRGVLEDAIDAGCDLFVTGEASEYVTHVARETGIHYAWAGHHATERVGVRALLDHLAKRFDVETFFIDEENPV